MASSLSQLAERCRKLGLSCDTIPTDRMSSVVAALSCFPMYMVANLHAWTTDKQWHLPALDLPGAEQIREAFAIGQAEPGSGEITKEHRRILGTLLTNAKPSDLVIYEYALETLEQLLGELAPPVAEQVRAGVARMIVAVAQASGEGWLGTGPKLGPEEAACIRQISDQLSLPASPAAAALLTGIV